MLELWQSNEELTCGKEPSSLSTDRYLVTNFTDWSVLRILNNHTAEYRSNNKYEQYRNQNGTKLEIAGHRLLVLYNL